MVDASPQIQYPAHMADVWTAFYTGLAGFSGTVFAITLAARTIHPTDEVSEKKLANRTRLWDAISVTFELAAASLLSILVPIRGTVPATLLATGIIFLGCGVYIVYLVVFLHQHGSGERHHWWGWVAFWWTVLPLAAYAVSFLFFWHLPLCVLPACLPVDEVLFPLSVGYLVISGIGQAFLWFWRSWDKPSDPPQDAVSVEPGVEPGLAVA